MQKGTTKQHILLLYLFLFPIFTVSLLSCEFNSDDDNFVFLEKPGEEIQIGIELTGINPAELIYAYNNTYFSYSLNTGGKNIFLRQFYLDGQPLETDQNTGIGYLNTHIADNDTHELKLAIALKTGTGSLAEYAGYEMYTGEFIFKIKIIPFSDKLNIRETRSQNNNLKLEWDKPADYEVWGYEVYEGDNHFGKLLTRITDPDETFFTNPDYAYGYKLYTVVAYVKNSFDITVVDNITVNHSNMMEENFEMYRTSLNELVIKWDNPNPFPCKYVLEYGYDNTIKIEDGVNEAIIPIPEFPSWSNLFTLYIIPESADIDQYAYYSCINVWYSDKQFSAISFECDPVNNMLHGLTFTSLNSYDLSSMEKAGSSKHNLTLHTGCKLQVTNQGMIAISDVENNVHIYSDYSLKNEIIVLNSGIYPFHLVSGNKLLIEERNGFRIHDVTTGAVICSRSWQSERPGGETIPSATISPDGKYVYVLCMDYHSVSPADQWTELYEIDANHSLQLLEKTKTADIQSVSFHPVKSTEVIIQYLPYTQNKFIIMDILTKEQKEIKGEFMNIDPFTGNLLFRGEEYLHSDPVLYVRDKNYAKEIIKLKLDFNNTAAPSYLFRNCLFFNNHYLNLSHLKEWKQ